jgi:hypothetical protein
MYASVATARKELDKAHEEHRKAKNRHDNSSHALRMCKQYEKGDLGKVQKQWDATNDARGKALEKKHQKRYALKEAMAAEELQKYDRLKEAIAAKQRIF